MEEGFGRIKAIIGLGNPGNQYYRNRHSIGFRILDEFARLHNISWRTKDMMEVALVGCSSGSIMLIKPQTFMNSSGKVVPSLLKQGIAPDEIMVVHDELELPFGTVKIKKGGSHRGHNGLRSIIGVCGPDFVRLRCGIGRPGSAQEVPDYVLANFNEPGHEVEQLIGRALEYIEQICSSKEG